MNPYLTAYRLVTAALYPLAFLAPKLLKTDGDDLKMLTGHFGRSLHKKERKNKIKIWMHAVSVGEVKAASAIMEPLLKSLPKSLVILSSSTRHGFNHAKEVARNDFDSDRVIPVKAPLDFPQAVSRALRSIRPDIFVILETELWPNWLVGCSRMGIPVVLINGRLSIRTVDRYMRIRSMMKILLAQIEAFSMIHSFDAERIEALGAPKERIHVNGNAKLDIRTPDILECRRLPENLLAISRSSPVFVAGSVRSGEFKHLSRAFSIIRERIPGAVLIAAPRHVEKAGLLASTLSADGMVSRMLSDLDSGFPEGRTKVIVTDTMGDLMNLYGISDVVFCGGSLVPLGGQNILEPAAWGKPVLFGPFMDDFIDAGRLLENSGGGRMVRDASELASWACRLLTDIKEARKMGQKALTALEKSRGAAARHAAVVEKVLFRVRHS